MNLLHKITARIFIKIIIFLIHAAVFIFILSIFKIIRTYSQNNELPGVYGISLGMTVILTFSMTVILLNDLSKGGIVENMYSIFGRKFHLSLDSKNNVCRMIWMNFSAIVSELSRLQNDKIYMQPNDRLTLFKAFLLWNKTLFICVILYTILTISYIVFYDVLIHSNVDSSFILLTLTVYYTICISIFIITFSIMLQAIRKKRQVLYGMIEIIFGIVTIIYATHSIVQKLIGIYIEISPEIENKNDVFLNLLSKELSSGSNLFSTSFAIFGGFYIIVRGIDNIKTGSKGNLTQTTLEWLVDWLSHDF